MKPSRWLALSAAFAVCAVLYGIHVSAKQEAPGPNTNAAVKSKAMLGERRPSSFRPASRPTTNRRRSAESRTGTAATAASVEMRKVTGWPEFSGGDVLPESEWRENAAMVEMQANHELDRLSALLDLDSYQQEKIFSSLAQRSSYWLPGMQTGGSARSGDLVSSGGSKQGPAAEKASSRKSSATAKAKADVVGRGGLPASEGVAEPVAPDLTAYLTADQFDAIAKDAMDREEWWAEVLPQLLPPAISEADSEVTLETEDSTLVDPPAETKVFDGGEMLFEE